MTYNDKLLASIRKSRSVLCIGLDPDPQKIPTVFARNYTDTNELVAAFCKKIIDITESHCCAYKPNLAFFEALGSKGLDTFSRVLESVPDDKIVIADAKRGDIGHTAGFYKKAYFDTFDVDAITLSPLMGFETLTPFLDDESKAVFVLALTSNPGADDFLKKPFDGFPKLSEYIAHNLSQLNVTHPGHIGMVVGATQTAELESVIRHHPKASLLIPGIGSQGGSIDELSQSLTNHEGLPVINSSRSILYAGGDDKNWESAVEQAARDVKIKLQTITERYV